MRPAKPTVEVGAYVLVNTGPNPALWHILFVQSIDGKGFLHGRVVASDNDNHLEVSPGKIAAVGATPDICFDIRCLASRNYEEMERAIVPLVAAAYELTAARKRDFADRDWGGLLAPPTAPGESAASDTGEDGR